MSEQGRSGDSDARRALDAAMTERVFMGTVIAAARTFGWRCYHPYDSRRSVEGYPDLTCVHRQHGVIWVELKTERGPVSPRQRDWHGWLWAAGQRVYIWRPRDFSSGAIEAVLRGEER